MYTEKLSSNGLDRPDYCGYRSLHRASMWRGGAQTPGSERPVPVKPVPPRERIHSIQLRRNTLAPHTAAEPTDGGDHRRTCSLAYVVSLTKINSYKKFFFKESTDCLNILSLLPVTLPQGNATNG